MDLVIARIMLCMLAFTTGMPAFSEELLLLEPGVPTTRNLSNGETHTYRVSVSGDMRIVVEHLGRGTILSICRDTCGQTENLFLRAASWRGPEHAYSTVVTLDGQAVIEVIPDEEIAPSGQYTISLTRYGPEQPGYAGERAMTLGADRHLRHYFGEADARTEALMYFEEAAKAFAASGNRRRLADAYFEGAVVNYYLGNNPEADIGFRAAEGIWSDVGDDRGVAAARNQRGLVRQMLGGSSDEGGAPPVAELFESAAQRRLALGDKFFYAQAVNNLGLVYQELGDGRLARRYFSEALASWQGSIDLMAADPAAVDFADAEHEPWLLHATIAIMNLGWAYDHSARPDLAERHYRQALAFSEYLERGRMVAEIRSNYGELMYRIGKLQTALSLMEDALTFFESEARDETWSAEVYHNLGLVYSASGDAERASASFNEALRLRTAERDPIGRAETLRNIALLGIDTENLIEVRALVNEALTLLGSGRNARIKRAGLLVIAGRINHQSGQIDDALRQYDDALELYRAIGNLGGETNARTSRAYAFHDLGRDIRAFAEFDVALELARQIESLGDEFRILTRLAKVRYDRREYGLAFARAKEAIAVSERLRDQLVHPALLRDYASVQHDAYEVLINASIRTGDVEAAWRASDYARARRFTELLRQTGAVLSAKDAARREQYVNLRLRVATLAEQRSEFLAQDVPDRAREVRRELMPLLNEMDSLTAHVSAPSDFRNPEISLEDVQDALGPKDLLMEFYLSPLGTGVWLIGPDSLDYVLLPKYAEIERSVLALRQVLQMPSSAVETEARQLSALLFGAGMDMFADVTRLIIIPDGPLHFVPFSVLRDLAGPRDEPLIATRDISYLPSAAALLELRRRDDNDGQGIAVLADPVFEATDPRVEVDADPTGDRQVAHLVPNVHQGFAASHSEVFPRLPGTREESRAIQDSAGSRPVRLFLDTEANRDIVLSGELDRYRILHFATHGVLDVEEPSLSGLVLSAVTANGRPRSKFLLTQDIVSMDLKADLVVLSGCDTGSGRSVRGEGLISLSRAFFYAGAEQVVSSLWQVPDRATAELMGVFYRRLLQNGDSPMVALREAQLHVMADRRWRSPYYWAAFVLQGDWTGGADSALSSTNTL